MSVNIKNIWLTRVDLNIELSAIEVSIYTIDYYEPELHNAFWTKLGVIQAIKYHRWIEPGEVVMEERLIALPNETPIALGLRLRLLAKVPVYAFWRYDFW